MTTKDTARRLRSALQEVTGQDISHSQALEIVARLLGYRDLHELQKREAAQDAQPVPALVPAVPKVEFTEEEQEILAEWARRDPSPVYDFEDAGPDRVATHHVEVPGVGIAHRSGGAGVHVVTPAKDTTCSSCGAAISAGELCTRSADKKGTIGGIRFTRCRTCQPITVTPRDPEAIRLDRSVWLNVYLTFRTRENAMVFFRLISDAVPEKHSVFTAQIEGERMVQAFGVRLPDMPPLN